MLETISLLTFQIFHILSSMDLSLEEHIEAFSFLEEILRLEKSLRFLVECLDLVQKYFYSQRGKYYLFPYGIHSTRND